MGGIKGRTMDKILFYPTQMTGIVLAGGKSQRMGEGKASLKIGRKQVIELILEKLRVTFDDVLIIGNSNFIYPLSQVKVLADIIPAKGPLGFYLP